MCARACTHTYTNIFKRQFNFKMGKEGLGKQHAGSSGRRREKIKKPERKEGLEVWLVREVLLRVCLIPSTSKQKDAARYPSPQYANNHCIFKCSVASSASLVNYYFIPAKKAAMKEWGRQGSKPGKAWKPHTQLIGVQSNIAILRSHWQFLKRLRQTF